MTKIICPCEECKWNSSKHICKAKEVQFTFNNLNTVWDGRKDVWICKQYEISDDTKEFIDNFKKLIAEHTYEEWKDK